MVLLVINFYPETRCPCRQAAAGAAECHTIRQGDIDSEENISAKQSQTQAYARVSGTHEHQGRPGGTETPPQKRPQGTQRLSCPPGSTRARPAQPMKAHSFRPRERLRKRQQFLHVFKNGIRRESEHFRCTHCRNGLTERRLGLTVGKRTGNAVVRNRIKRLLKEFFRRNKALFPESADIVISAKAGAGHMDYTSTEQELGALLRPGARTRHPADTGGRAFKP